MKKIILFALLVGTFAACSQSAKQESETATAEVTESNLYGADFTTETVLMATNLSEMMDGHSSKEVTVKGTVLAVCKNKGCWMDVDLGNDDKMKVRFKDYGFFVPMDIDSQTVTMAGVASFDTISVETLQHYAEDAGKTAEEVAMITEPEFQLVFEATGVKLGE